MSGHVKDAKPFGDTVTVQEMQSEGGASGLFMAHCKQELLLQHLLHRGLLLMIPNMYKIAGEFLPCVFHVSARTLATHSLCIFGDHSDVMACRQTGFAMLCEGSVQEVMDLSAVAHLATIETRVPFLNFFDGFRTSHEYHKIEQMDMEDLRPLVDQKALSEFCARALFLQNILWPRVWQRIQKHSSLIVRLVTHSIQMLWMLLKNTWLRYQRSQAVNISHSLIMVLLMPIALLF